MNVVKVRTLSHSKWILDNTIKIVLTPQRVGLTLIIMAENSKTIKLETDYLIVGGGAMGMAFVDEMLNRSFNCGNNQNTEFIIIDKHAKPGGHWNDAYTVFHIISQTHISKYDTS